MICSVFRSASAAGRRHAAAAWPPVIAALSVLILPASRGVILSQPLASLGLSTRVGAALMRHNRSAPLSRKLHALPGCLCWQRLAPFLHWFLCEHVLIL